MTYEDISGLVVAEANEDSEILDVIYKNIEGQIKRDKRPFLKS